MGENRESAILRLIECKAKIFEDFEKNKDEYLAMGRIFILFNYR